jgi:hypothetical protein
MPGATGDGPAPAGSRPASPCPRARVATPGRAVRSRGRVGGDGAIICRIAAKRLTRRRPQSRGQPKTGCLGHVDVTGGNAPCQSTARRNAASIALEFRRPLHALLPYFPPGMLISGVVGRKLGVA